MTSGSPRERVVVGAAGLTGLQGPPGSEMLHLSK